MSRKHDIFFLTLLSLIFIALTVVFCFFPRSVFSELERRELKKFPEFSVEKLKDGSFAADISEWFSDSEPYRDAFMSANMEFKRLLALQREDDEAVSFHASSDGGADVSNAMMTGISGDRDIEAVEGVGAEENGKLASSGIIIAGKGPNARALMIFGGSAKGKSSYAETLNEYRGTLPSSLRVYAMVIPTSIEFYCPDKVRGHTRSQLESIRNIYSQLDPGVTAVDVYTPLGHHAAEPIFLRTDHHWAPLGAFYAAEQFARTAGVPFAPLSAYNKRVLHDFVGTMYGYSKDIAIKNAPEDFVYYTPKDSSYVATVIDFELDKNFQISKEHPARRTSFFQRFKHGSGMAYSTFMGGDRKIMCVKTNVKNGRKLLIIKDSFGNALPGYFFSSFGEVHVVDFRYFNRDLRKYISDNGITDLVISLNIFNANSSSVAKKISALLHRGNPTRNESANTSAIQESFVKSSQESDASLKSKTTSSASKNERSEKTEDSLNKKEDSKGSVAEKKEKKENVQENELDSKSSPKFKHKEVPDSLRLENQLPRI